MKIKIKILMSIIFALLIILNMSISTIYANNSNIVNFFEELDKKIFEINQKYMELYGVNKIEGLSHSSMIKSS